MALSLKWDKPDSDVQFADWLCSYHQNTVHFNPVFYKVKVNLHFRNEWSE